MAESVEAPAARENARFARRVGYGSAFLIALLLIAVLGVGVQAVGDIDKFAKVTLNGLTLSGIYFIVASGFTLIFGLMRIVNMAQGSFYMLAGIMAFLIQERMLGDEAGSGFGPPQATLAQYLVPLVIATLSVAILGLIIQQAFLRWNQGQELRQALITIALSIIIADQAVARFGGIAKEIAIPVGESVKLPWIGSYGSMRLIVMGVAILVGILLFLLITRTRFGMHVRAGVDDRQMASALGVNIQVIFAAGFFLGAALAGLAGVLGASVISVNKADDGKFLLISLIVVIIGGMGSLTGAAIGALLLGLIDSYGDVYLPSGFSNYSVLLTFLLLVVILAVRPYGLFGRPGSG